MTESSSPTPPTVHSSPYHWRDLLYVFLLGIVLLYLGLGGVVAGAPGIILDVLGAIFLLTGLVGFCPLYTLFKFSTKKS